VVLLGELATDIPQAWLLKINDFQTSKFPDFLSLRAWNQVVGGLTHLRKNRVWRAAAISGGISGGTSNYDVKKQTLIQMLSPFIRILFAHQKIQ
jgi:hypothetical protein